MSKKRFSSLLLVVFLALLVFGDVRFGAPALVADEVEALREIAKKLGKTNWDFNVDPCSGESGWRTVYPEPGKDNVVNCSCSDPNNTVCHVTVIILESQNLSGVLPPELVKLPYLQEIDLTRNYLNGSIPKEWGSMQLLNIHLIGNRLSGSIPIELANITTLRALTLSFNQFSGVLPPELGNLTRIDRLVLSSNSFNGTLPETFAKLTTLTDFQVSDNQFSGKIPNFIENWTNLRVLRMHASGLEGPIPSSISLLTELYDMRISDLNGTDAAFPLLENMKNMTTLVLRSCNIIGEIPPYLGSLTNLKQLDLSFNKLSAQIPSSLNSLSRLDYVYLTGNALTGPVPEAMLRNGKKIDLSYNNIQLPNSVSPNCQERDVNLFRSSSLGNNSIGVIPCLKSFRCPKYSSSSFHINCGGKEVVAEGSKIYEDDSDSAGASMSMFFHRRDTNWGYSSTGNFMDRDNIVDSYIAENTSELTMKDPALYMTARLSPLSFTYYGICLAKGNYTVNLHFAEIMFTNDKTYASLGRRIFDIYIQGIRVKKDFNIEDEAHGVGRSITETFNAVVTDTTLEIRFYWAGRGTTRIPSPGIYGPLISAISVNPDFKPPSEDKRKISPGLVVGIVSLVLSLIVTVTGILWWKGRFGRKNKIVQDMVGRDLPTDTFTLTQITTATNNFDTKNKIGEGGFGAVYKGHLSDGTAIAVKQLSSKSMQGNREFLNEIGMISALQHPNLVKLYGCCIEENQLLLVYEYMENNSLAHALFGLEDCKLDWPTRHKIIVGMARALAYLHEESRLKVVHRDIKAANILLDKGLNPKISDFGFARLYEQDNSQISTRVAGTFGYMAPEYAMKGYLTDKIDVYSFGVVALEIISGKKNTDFILNAESLLDWALVLQKGGDLMKLVDPKLESKDIESEVLRMINVALLCTNVSPTLRPKMSAVVSMLKGRTLFQNFVSDSSTSNMNHYKLGEDQSMRNNQNQSTSMYAPLNGGSRSASDMPLSASDQLSYAGVLPLPDS